MVNLVQRYRPYGVYVTDLTAQLWCEKQLEFTLELGRIETKEMKNGRERHTNLHEEVAILVTVEPRSLEDSVALKLHNCLVGLARLLREGMTREIPIWGTVNSLFVVGVADELRLENGNLILLDTKTRKSESMPSEVQKRTTRFQLMLYKHLFDSIKINKFTSEQLMNYYKFDKKSRITKEFQKQISKLASVEPNLGKLSQNVFDIIKKFPEISKGLQVRYEYRGTKKVVGIDNFQFNSQQFKDDCNFVEGFWLEKRKAIPVGETNRWKCNYCNFREKCFSTR